MSLVWSSRAQRRQKAGMERRSRSKRPGRLALAQDQDMTRHRHRPVLLRTTPWLYEMKALYGMGLLPFADGLDPSLYLVAVPDVSVADTRPFCQLVGWSSVP